MEKIKNCLKETKILGIIGNIILIIAVFLPVLTVTVSLFGISQSETVNYIQGDGKIVLILAIVNLVIIFADKFAGKVKFLSKLTNQKLTLIPTAISIIILFVLISNKEELLGTGVSSLYNIKYGIGFYLLWLGVIASAVYPFLYKKESTTTTPVEPAPKTDENE